METSRNIDVPVVSSLLTLKRFYTFSQYFIVEFGGVLPAAFTCRDQNRGKSKLRNMQAQVIKQVKLIKQVKGQQEKKPVSNLKSMQIVGFEKTPTKFNEIFVL